MTRSPLSARALGLGLLLVATSLPALAAPPAAKPAKGRKHAAPKVDRPGKGAPAKPAAAPSAPAPLALTLPLQRVTLENGLRVVVDVDHASPTVAIAVVYDVGARDEERGRSGFADLVEHLMFQGSANVAAGDHERLVSSHGGVLGGATGVDRTAYFETLPAGELALGLWLEADRMRSLDLSEESLRKVVEDEHRRRAAGVAYAPSAVRLGELAYQGCWPYEHPPLGTLADLDGARLPAVQAFHAAHYGPGAAALVIAGDVDPAEAIGLAHRYFDAVPRSEAAPHADAPLPEQTSQRTAIVRDDLARTPGVFYGWAVPPTRSTDHDALALAAVILGDGEGSRLHQLLVRDRPLAQRVSAGVDGRRGPDLLRLDAVLAEGARTADVERIVEAEVKALATRGPTDAELERARRRLEAALVLGLQSSAARALRLGAYEVSYGDAGLLAGELPRIFAVTRDDVKRAVAEHLGPTRRTLVEALPAAAPEPAARPAARAAPAPPKKAAGKPRKKKP